MSDINSIAAGAVANYQKALATVANNIANVDSEGYSRQEVSLSENTPTKFGTSFFGTGARLDGVKRLYDGFIENSLRNSTSDLGQQGPMVDYSNRILNILGSETVGLTSALDQFFNSARELSTDPASLIRRTVFLSDSENLKVSTFKYFYYFILISHILLSAIIMPLVLVTWSRALKEKFEAHKKIARITFPIWLYVSATGVLVYILISPYY